MVDSNHRRTLHFAVLAYALSTFPLGQSSKYVCLISLFRSSSLFEKPAGFAADRPMDIRYYKNRDVW